MSAFSIQADPLLFGRSPIPTRQQYDYSDTQKMLEGRYNEYKSYMSDYTATLDEKISSLSEEELDLLNQDEEYMTLSKELSGYIQAEMLLLIKSRINTNPSAVKNIERQIAIIESTKAVMKHKERESMQELRDYLKNYSSLSFDEYKRLKSEARDPKSKKKD